MQLNSVPPITKYDLRFRIAGIPIRVHPLFWLMTIALGTFTRDIVHLLIWIPVVFLSILVHELGHALAMRIYKQPAQVFLHMTGGVTVPEMVRWGRSWANISLRPDQEILVSLLGPLAGFILAVLIMIGVVLAGGSIVRGVLFGIFPMPTVLLPNGGNVINLVVSDLLWVNIFWGILNLMPVYPLDGGNLTRHILDIVTPLQSVRISLWISLITGGVIAVASLVLFRSIYIMLLFAILALQSYLVLQGREHGF